MRQPESKFKRKLHEAFDAVFSGTPRWWSYFPIGLGSKPGTPDMCFALLNGFDTFSRQVWVEAKWGNGKLRPSQQHTLLQMRDAGMRVVVLAGDENGVRLDAIVGSSHYFHKDEIKEPHFWKAVFGVA